MNLFAIDKEKIERSLDIPDVDTYTPREILKRIKNCLVPLDSEKKEEQYKCQSYYGDDGILHNCTCDNCYVEFPEQVCKEQRCTKCNGEGDISFVFFTQRCIHCNGTGKEPRKEEELCPVCEQPISECDKQANVKIKLAIATESIREAEWLISDGSAGLKVRALGILREALSKIQEELL